MAISVLPVGLRLPENGVSLSIFFLTFKNVCLNRPSFSYIVNYLTIKTTENSFNTQQVRHKITMSIFIVNRFFDSVP